MHFNRTLPCNRGCDGAAFRLLPINIYPRYLTIVLFWLSANLSAQPAYNVTVNPGAPGGYYFTGPFEFFVPGSHQMILDSSGHLVYFKPFSQGPFPFAIVEFKILPNGQMCYYRKGKFFLMDSTFTVVDSVYVRNGYLADSHDLQVLPNGNYLLLAEETVTMDLQAYPYFNGNGSPGSAAASVTCGIIQEQDPSKTVVFEWHAKDHFSFDGVDQFWLNLPNKVDWTHFNALEVDDDNNLLVCSRHFNEITKINRSNGSVMWRFGGKYNQFTYTGDTLPFYGQHDIRRISNGNITLFDNGNHFSPHPARAVEYELDEVSKTAKLVWQYAHDTTYSSIAMGNVERLYNGSTLVNYGYKSSDDNICFDVVDSSRNTLFKIAFDDTLYSYRTYHYRSLPFKISRPHINCFDSAGSKYLSAPAGHSSYKWNTGASSRLIPVLSAGEYFVFVSNGNGGFVSSEILAVNDLLDYCNFTGVNKVITGDEINFFPNPAGNILHVNMPVNSNKLFPRLFDMYGKEMSAPAEIILSHETIRVDISGLSEGIYFLIVNEISYKVIVARM
jgi:hypothetical protein